MTGRIDEQPRADAAPAVGDGRVDGLIAGSRPPVTTIPIEPTTLSPSRATYHAPAPARKPMRNSAWRARLKTS